MLCVHYYAVCALLCCACAKLTQEGLASDTWSILGRENHITRGYNVVSDIRTSIQVPRRSPEAVVRCWLAPLEFRQRETWRCCGPG